MIGINTSTGMLSRKGARHIRWLAFRTRLVHTIERPDEWWWHKELVAAYENTVPAHVAKRDTSQRPTQREATERAISLLLLWLPFVSGPKRKHLGFGNGKNGSHKRAAPFERLGRARELVPFAAAHKLHFSSAHRLSLGTRRQS